MLCCGRYSALTCVVWVTAYSKGWFVVGSEDQWCRMVSEHLSALPLFQGYMAGPGTVRRQMRRVLREAEERLNSEVHSSGHSQQGEEYDVFIEQLLTAKARYLEVVRRYLPGWCQLRCCHRSCSSSCPCQVARKI
jgi:hypothetical protein